MSQAAPLHAVVAVQPSLHARRLEGLPASQRPGHDVAPRARPCVIARLSSGVMAIQNFSHVGLCVSDLVASAAFYRDALGFEVVHRIDVAGPDAERLLELSPVKLEATYLERDGVVIELLAFEQPGHEPRDGPRPMNRAGLTHLSLRVSDLDACIERVESAGGRALSDTLVRRPEYGMAVVFVVDPDGTRIELLQAPGDPRQLPGA